MTIDVARLCATVAIAAALSAVPALAPDTPAAAAAPVRATSGPHDTRPGDPEQGPHAGHDMDMDMDGMEHDDAPSDGPDAVPHGHEGGATESPQRPPRTAVLSTFGALNAGVLVSAAAVKRRERARPRHRPRGAAPTT